MRPSIKTLSVCKSEMAACPKCDASLKFYKSDKPDIDACGFESYSLTCAECNLIFVGIIDPQDDGLLLTISSYVGSAPQAKAHAPL